MKKITWLVIANSTDAFIYEIEKHHNTSEKKSQHRLIQHLTHEASHLKTSELGTDKPGHYKSYSSARGQFTPPHDAHRDEQMHFAQEISEFLENERKKHHYEALILCAEPRFHGLLDTSLSELVHALITHHIKKDYIPFPTDKLNQTIEKFID